MGAMRNWGRYVGLLLLMLCVGLSLGALLPSKKSRRLPRRLQPAQLAQVDFEREVRPILQARCFTCHGPDRHRGGLRLDTIAALRKGATGGAVIVPGDGANSLLIATVSGDPDKPPMPPAGNRLSAREIALLKAWIDGGALAPDNVETETGRSNHWAFRPPKAAPVPAVDKPEWARNPIDAFLAAGQQKVGLIPNTPISRELLLRRVSLDLIGLPPTRTELLAFLADTSADAYDKAVDRLLASPRYGEHWGRHWMDVWRYSDPDGRKAKYDIWWGSAHIWRWRDWIIHVLNADKGYDRMVIEMLAGDEAAPGDPEALAATGFLVRNWFKLSRNIGLNNVIEHTGKAFLGITLNCARCHDHKFDPIAQKEYYQFRAIFQAHDVCTDLPAGEGPTSPQGLAHACDVHPDEPTWIFVRGDEQTPDKTIPIKPGLPLALGGLPLRVQPISGTSGCKPQSTGRRLALARWLTDCQNPLTARVAVNHIWARHFGRPLVENVADFGVRTPAPVQQPLLDYLAVKFMDQGWSMKWLHRLIVTSAAYKMKSSLQESAAHNLAVDPDNQFYWRMNARRMEAEELRDSLLWLGGALDTTAGGPPIDPMHGTDSARRSIYYRYSREDKMDFLTTFDSPGVEECYRRQESIVPQQALALENSEFTWQQARRIARRLEAERSDRAGFVDFAFEHILGRAPTIAEKQECESFLASQERLLADSCRLTRFPPPQPPAPVDPEFAHRVPGLPLVLSSAPTLPPVIPSEDPAGRAREYLIHVLLNHNDFITIR